VHNLVHRVLVLAALPALAAGTEAQITEFPVPTASSRPYTIVAGPDGNLWFTESNGNKIARITTAGTITEFPVPTAASGPYGIAIGRDGNVWFTERFANQIGRYTPSTGLFREFPIPTPFSQPWEIALAPDGNLWFTEEDAGLIGRITPTGAIREFTPPSCCFPTGITAGQDGNVWFTLEIGDQIGRVEPTGAMTMFPIPNVQVLPWDIAPGLDGGLWFTELAGRAVGRISLAGQVVELPVPGPFSGIAGVAAGADGLLWFTENDTDHVGAMDATGAVVQLLNTSPGARPLSITLGPDGNLWFTEADRNAIGRVNLGVTDRVHVLALDAGFAPRLRRATMGKSVQWVFLGPNAHSVVDASGLGLFDSGPRSFVSYLTLTALSAGTFVYHDGTGVAPDAAITIPVTLPAAASAGVPFPVTWSLVQAPPGLVFDVQVRVPGAPSFANLTSGPSRNGSYTAAAPGPYQFRARLRDPVSGQQTLYSLPALVVVL
jgi:virginiamycin B lyase